MDKSNSGKRYSNLELLRIISIILIIAHHYAVHGFSQAVYLDTSFNSYILDILSLGGKIGVSCFILLSGYFMINNKFTIKKLWKIVGQVFFYSAGALLIFCTIFNGIYTIKFHIILKSIFPIMLSSYWFVTSYITLMIISPYLNKFIHSLEKKELEKFILLMVFMWSILATFAKNTLGFNNLGWFIVLYCIAAYIRLYVNLEDINVKKNKIILCISSIILILSTVGITKLGESINNLIVISKSTYFSNFNSFIVLIISVTMFIYFATKKPFVNPIINEVAKCSFGIYLLNDNFLVRPFLWNIIVKCNIYYRSSFLILHAIFSVVAIYLFCAGVEYVRMTLIEPLWMKIYDFLEKYFQKNRDSFRELIKIE